MPPKCEVPHHASSVRGKADRLIIPAILVTARRGASRTFWDTCSVVPGVHSCARGAVLTCAFYSCFPIHGTARDELLWRGLQSPDLPRLWMDTARGRPPSGLSAGRGYPAFLRGLLAGIEVRDPMIPSG
jgi:hypothetical protein